MISRADLQCIESSCGQRQTLDSDVLACPACGGLLEVAYHFEPISGAELRERWRARRLSGRPEDASGVWRFRELLPFLDPGARIITLAEGSTPLVPAPKTGEWAGGVRLAVKHQGANPTGSFKDIGMTACISRAAARDARIVACASTGNTSSSMAAYAARAGIKAMLFVPYRQISAAKLAQAVDFGALVLEVGDTFDQAFSLLRQVAREFGLYLVNSVNPFRIEGQKTIVPEMLEQRGWKAPDYIVVPGGNLGNASAIGKGLRELAALGLIARPPRIVVVQAEGAAPFYRMWASGSEALKPVDRPTTQASAIRIGAPENWKKAKRALEWTGGLCESVTDEEILEAKRALASDGIGCEPASAAAAAGLRKLCRAGIIEPGAEAVAVLTGNQLKDTDYIMRHQAGEENGPERQRVEPNLDALRRALDSVLSARAV